jgi:hypothetical protein
VGLGPQFVDDVQAGGRGAQGLPERVGQVFGSRRRSLGRGEFGKEWK